MSDISSDRPSLNLSKMGAVWWITKKHAWHLFLKTVIAVFLVFWGISLFKQFPVIMTKALSKSLTPSKLVPDSEKTTVPEVPPPSPAVVPGNRPMTMTAVVPVTGHSCGNPNCTEDHSLPVLKSNEKITAVFPLGVITDNGRRRVGQPVSLDGVEEIIKSINVRQGVVSFESGKKITVPK